MATHSSTLAWKILWTEEPEGVDGTFAGGGTYYSHFGVRPAITIEL